MYYLALTPTHSCTHSYNKPAIMFLIERFHDAEVETTDVVLRHYQVPVTHAMFETNGEHTVDMVVKNEITSDALWNYRVRLCDKEFEHALFDRTLRNLWNMNVPSRPYPTRNGLRLEPWQLLSHGGKRYLKVSVLDRHMGTDKDEYDDQLLNVDTGFYICLILPYIDVTLLDANNNIVRLI